jgi:hypothetical protein
MADYYQRQYDNDIFSPEIRSVLTHLIKTKAISKVMTERQENAPDLGIASFRPKDRSLALIAGDKNAADTAAAHEILHVPNTGKTGIQRFSELEEKFLKLGGNPDEITRPKHWTQGALDSTTGIKPGSKMHQLALETENKRLNDVRSSIPPGAEWSGLSAPGPKSIVGLGGHEEAGAYYHTDPRVAKPAQPDRAKEFGMFLIDRGVPMPQVEALVKRMSELLPPTRFYSGGRANLERLRERDK